jgi:uncharacterized protein
LGMATRADTAAVAKKESASYKGLLVPAILIGVAVVLYFVLPTEIAAPGFTLLNFITLAGILYLAGVMSGMCGFGFAAPGAMSLFLLPPVTAIPMLQGLSVCNQAMSISKLRKDMPRTWKQWFPNGPLPVIMGGLLGVPVGVYLLNNLSTRTLTIVISSLIIGYSLYSMYKPPELAMKRFTGPFTGAACGAVGAAVGGFTAQPGMVVIIWMGLRNASKLAQRAMVQPFIITMQLSSILTNAYQNPHNFGARYWIMLLLTVPVVLPGTLTGVWLFHRLSERDFKRASYGLLGLGAVALMLRTLLR